MRRTQVADRGAWCGAVESHFGRLPVQYDMDEDDVGGVRFCSAGFGDLSYGEPPFLREIGGLRWVAVEQATGGAGDVAGVGTYRASKTADIEPVMEHQAARELGVASVEFVMGRSGGRVRQSRYSIDVA